MFGSKRLWLTLMFALSCCAAVHASAQESASSNNDAKPAFNKWSCFPFKKSSLYDFEVSGAGVRVNNVNVAAGKEFITDAPTLSLSVAVANRSEVNVAVTVEVVGMSGTSPTFAISGEIPFGYIAPDKNDEIKSAIVTDKDSLKSSDTLCIRVSGYRKKG